MIFKCLECDILKFRKPLSEFRKVAFNFAWRRNSENKKPIFYILDLIVSISEINNHILRKLKTKILFQNFRKCRSDFNKLFSFFLTFAQIRKLFSDIPKIFSFFMNTILSSPKFFMKLKLGKLQSVKTRAKSI